MRDMEAKKQGWKVGDMAKCAASISVSCARDAEEYAKGTLKTPLEVGLVYEVTEVSHVGNQDFISVMGNGHYVHGTYASMFIKINNTNVMKITNLVKKLLDKDTQTLVKAGFVNGDLALTEEGTTELISILFIEKKAELVKLAEEKNAEAKN